MLCTLIWGEGLQFAPCLIQLWTILTLTLPIFSFMPVFCQLTVRPCGAVSFNRLPRPQGFVVNPLPVSPSPVSGGDSQGLSVSLTDTSPAPPALRSPRGSRGLSSQAKSKLVFSVSHLEKKYGRHSLTFWTATVPTDDPVKLREILEKSKEILKYLRYQLTKYLAQLGLPAEVILVAELQRRGALHFHAVFVGKLYGRKVDRYQLDRLWERVLRAKVVLPSTLSFKSACRTEPVRKSVGRYLSKYLSKSISKETSLTQGLSISWYSVGSDLTRLYWEILEQNKFPADLRSSVFYHSITALSQILIAPKLVAHSDFLLGVTGFASDPPAFFAALWRNFPYLAKIFGVPLPS